MGELIGNLIGQGVRHIANINTGVSTEAPLRIVDRGMLQRHGISIPTADMSRLCRTSDKLLQQKVGGHADEHETSIMLAIDQSRVNLGGAVADYGDALDRRANVFHRPGKMSDSPRPKRRLRRSEHGHPGKGRSHPGGHDRGTAGRAESQPSRSPGKSPKIGPAIA
jgi:creatinine amidohydrolase/Fe(II)-dependent formamide hydrolase-like protein